MVSVDDHGRPEPEPAVGELETLLGYLEFHRATLEWKTRGLSAEQLRRTTAASSMTLGGLLMHMAYVEDHWFIGVVHDRERMPPWSTVDWKATPDWEWDASHVMSGDEMRAQWNTSVERCRVALEEALVAAGARATGAQAAGDRAAGAMADPLGALAKRAFPSGERPSLRWILMHMIEEYARHNGHADLLREAVDGETGE
ncbi:MAG: DinB family protein [Ilumatobacteraceae bacterium]